MLCRGIVYRISLSFFLIFPMRCSFHGPCSIISFKISTAYDVPFLRYRPSNLILTTDSMLVLVFVNLLWAMYLQITCLLKIFYQNVDYHTGASGKFIKDHDDQLQSLNIPDEYPS